MHRIDKPVLVIGVGGHAKVLVDCLLMQKISILGILDSDPLKHQDKILGVPVLGDDALLSQFPPDTILLVNGIGSVRTTALREKIFSRFSNLGYRFASVIHPSAIISQDVIMGEGAQVMAGAIIQAGSRLEKNVIINTHAAIDHDCFIGSHAHIAPGVVLSGNAVIGMNAHVGTGARVIQGIEIGEHCLIGSGAVVIRHVPDNSTVVGVPAKRI